MFYAIVFLTMLPKPLCEHINGYLGDRAFILWKEAEHFHEIVNRVYSLIGSIIQDKASNICKLPMDEFRRLFFEAYDLKVGFTYLLEDVFGRRTILFGDRNFIRRDWPFERILSLHDELFTRATANVISVVNLVRRLSWQTKDVRVGWVELSSLMSSLMSNLDCLREANRRHVYNRLIYSPAEVLNTDLLDVPLN